ncbi:hypothetical protein ABBQ38_007688 [Trebouxia sp. C0009 RCD-2024]
MYSKIGEMLCTICSWFQSIQEVTGFQLVQEVTCMVPMLFRYQSLTVSLLPLQVCLHGDLALGNFGLAPGHTTVWLLDFEFSHLGGAEEQHLEMPSLEDLLGLAYVSQNDT